MKEDKTKDVYEEYAADMGYETDKIIIKEVKVKHDRCDKADRECINTKNHNTKKKTNIKKK